MINFLARLAQTVALQDCVLVRVAQVAGSAPREVGAAMAVTLEAEFSTIGGGHLELQAIARARELLQSGDTTPCIERYALGPTLGQCCGGVVHLCFELISAGSAWPAQALRELAAGRSFAVPSMLLPQRLEPHDLRVALFGGGHVGHAIIEVLALLPCRVHWIDSRDQVFLAALPANVLAEHSAPVQDAVSDIAADSHVLIMSFSHAEDLDVLIACLLRQRAERDLASIGLIGSKTKWATFQNRLRERGFSDAELAQVTCPIGVPGIGGKQAKQPHVIAVAVAAQLLQRHSGG
jgi:xanthine dehydrogenase accessory factor